MDSKISKSRNFPEKSMDVYWRLVVAQPVRSERG